MRCPFCEHVCATRITTKLTQDGVTRQYYCRQCGDVWDWGRGKWDCRAMRGHEHNVHRRMMTMLSRRHERRKRMRQ